MAPYKYPQPWLIEIGNMHGHGANICFPDGSIRTMNDVIGPM
jgi:prepilin-type processing-associated H-X9-DG protein